MNSEPNSTESLCKLFYNKWWPCCRKRSLRTRKSDNVELRVFDEAGAQYPSFCRNHVLHEKNRRSIMSEEMLYSFLSTRNSEVPTTSRNASRYSSSTNYENSNNQKQMYMNISYKQQEPSIQPGNTGSNHHVPTIEISQQITHTKNRTPNNNIHELQTENCTSMVENELYGWGRVENNRNIFILLDILAD